MEGDEESYEELTRRAKRLWRENKVRQAADTDVLAANRARSLTDKAQSLLSAANNYGLAGDDARRTETALAAMLLWMEAAESATEIHHKIDLLWNAVRTAVAAGDEQEQLHTVTSLTQASKDISVDDREILLKRCLRQFRSRTAEARNILTKSLASTYVAKADTQYDEERLTTLRKADSLFLEVSDADRHAEVVAAISDTQTAIMLEKRRQGRAIEKTAAQLPFLEDKARAYEAASLAYAGHCDEDSHRCRAMAKDLRTKAMAEAASIPGIRDAESRLQEILADISAASELDLVADDDEIVVTDVTGMLQELDSRDQAIELLAARLGIPLEDHFALGLFRSALLSVGTWSSHQPFPDQMPIEVTKTRWRRSVLAIILAALIGGGAGAANGDWGDIATGALGAEAGISINILSGYMSRSKSRNEAFWNQLEGYSSEPYKMLILAHLKNRSMTSQEISNILKCSPSTARKLLNELAADDAITKERGVRGAWLWTMKES
ncbi:hypothetical protein ACFYNL_35170 [Streptomyces sp. NPDC007808]|uniref:hypothetical protein n=1 Tax=Streptomyces sp. NPDC007808 TaxID=3364779 RepID=UPI00367A78F7